GRPHEWHASAVAADRPIAAAESTRARLNIRCIVSAPKGGTTGLPHHPCHEKPPRIAIIPQWTNFNRRYNFTIYTARRDFARFQPELPRPFLEEEEIDRPIG